MRAFAGPTPTDAVVVVEASRGPVTPAMDGRCSLDSRAAGFAAAAAGGWFSAFAVSAFAAAAAARRDADGELLGTVRMLAIRADKVLRPFEVERPLSEADDLLVDA